MSYGRLKKSRKCVRHRGKNNRPRGVPGLRAKAHYAFGIRCEIKGLRSRAPSSTDPAPLARLPILAGCRESASLSVRYLTESAC